MAEPRTRPSEHRAKWDALRAAYPDIQIRATCFAGWRALVESYIVQVRLALPDGARLMRVRAREKHGLLSVACRVTSPSADTLRHVTAASQRVREASTRTCVLCGHPGRLRSTGWRAILCDEHAFADESVADELDMLEEATRQQRAAEIELGLRRADHEHGHGREDRDADD